MNLQDEIKKYRSKPSINFRHIVPIVSVYMLCILLILVFVQPLGAKNTRSMIGEELATEQYEVVDISNNSEYTNIQLQGLVIDETVVAYVITDTATNQKYVVPVSNAKSN